jgi:hypothetical protein
MPLFSSELKVLCSHISPALFQREGSLEWKNRGVTKSVTGSICRKLNRNVLPLLKQRRNGAKQLDPE